MHTHDDGMEHPHAGGDVPLIHMMISMTTALLEVGGYVEQADGFKKEWQETPTDKPEN